MIGQWWQQFISPSALTTHHSHILSLCSHCQSSTHRLQPTLSPHPNPDPEKPHNSQSICWAEIIPSGRREKWWLPSHLYLPGGVSLPTAGYLSSQMGTEPPPLTQTSPLTACPPTPPLYCRPTPSGASWCWQYNAIQQLTIRGVDVPCNVVMTVWVAAQHGYSLLGEQSGGRSSAEQNWAAEMLGCLGNSRSIYTDWFLWAHTHTHTHTQHTLLIALQTELVSLISKEVIVKLSAGRR